MKWYNYLGSAISGGRCLVETRTRICGKSSLLCDGTNAQQLKNSLAVRKKCSSTNIEAILLYACETWRISGECLITGIVLSGENAKSTRDTYRKIEENN